MDMINRRTITSYSLIGCCIVLAAPSITAQSTKESTCWSIYANVGSRARLYQLDQANLSDQIVRNYTKSQLFELGMGIHTKSNWFVLASLIGSITISTQDRNVLLSQQLKQSYGDEVGVERINLRYDYERESVGMLNLGAGREFRLGRVLLLPSVGVGSTSYLVDTLTFAVKNADSGTDYKIIYSAGTPARSVFRLSAALDVRYQLAPWLKLGVGARVHRVNPKFRYTTTRQDLNSNLAAFGEGQEASDWWLGDVSAGAYFILRTSTTDAPMGNRPDRVKIDARKVRLRESRHSSRDWGGPPGRKSKSGGQL